jgi:hypothetical protein
MKPDSLRERILCWLYVRGARGTNYRGFQLAGYLVARIPNMELTSNGMKPSNVDVAARPGGKRNDLC